MADDSGEAIRKLRTVLTALTLPEFKPETFRIPGLLSPGFLPRAAQIEQTLQWCERHPGDPQAAEILRGLLIEAGFQPAQSTPNPPSAHPNPPTHPSPNPPTDPLPAAVARAVALLRLRFPPDGIPPRGVSNKKALAAVNEKLEPGQPTISAASISRALAVLTKNR